MKKAIIIIGSILGGTILALSAVFLIMKLGNHIVPDAPLSVNSETESVISQPVDVPPAIDADVLTFTSPNSESFNTENDSLTFSGNIKGKSLLTLNGEAVECDEAGNFTKNVTLNYGNNTFEFKLGDTLKTFNVYRRYVIIKTYSPNTSQTLSAGAKLNVTATARTGATITAKFNGETVTLNEKSTGGDGFSTFTGNFTLPTGHYVDKNLGKVTFTAKHGGFSESFTSQQITCKREDIVVDFDPNSTPQGGNYINVGSGIICEVVAFNAETFNGNDNKDTSRPYNNYLPKGTVDYSSSKLLTVKGSDGYSHQLVKLRCGRQVYLSKRRKPYKDYTLVTKQYVGTLPDHNEISIAGFTSDGSHTKLTLDTMWKAPFDFKLLDQSYNSDFTVNDVTFNYVDITFNYATVFEGDISLNDNHPLFKDVKIIKNKSDYTLRFILKKQGGFYGWDAYYNDQNQLCFEFLNPVKVMEAQNEYGADLSGAKILIDIGHGGKVDTGSVGKNNVAEKDRNLALGNKIKSELESLGATVYITRTSDVEQLSDYKMQLLSKLKPDYCIAVHHDGNNASSLNGFGSYYYHPFSKSAAQFMQNRNINLNVYKKTTLKWHYYFMGRSSVCPVVLTENGYMTNSYDYGNIINDSVNTKKAKAITQGIVDYFLSIR